MQRDLKKKLLKWKTNPLRTPLIVRGARQVGKTYVIENFAKTEFDHLLIINFEKMSEYLSCFETLEPASIINQIQLISKQKITPGKSLLFLDEIQAVPELFAKLRWLAEDMPQLPVIAAGSLL